jgi:hypothetical protein
MSKDVAGKLVENQTMQKKFLLNPQENGVFELKLKFSETFLSDYFVKNERLIKSINSIHKYWFLKYLFNEYISTNKYRKELDNYGVAFELEEKSEFVFESPIDLFAALVHKERLKVLPSKMDVLKKIFNKTSEFTQLKSSERHALDFINFKSKKHFRVDLVVSKIISIDESVINQFVNNIKNIPGITYRLDKRYHRKTVFSIWPYTLILFNDLLGDPYVSSHLSSIIRELVNQRYANAIRLVGIESEKRLEDMYEQILRKPAGDDLSIGSMWKRIKKEVRKVSIKKEDKTKSVIEKKVKACKEIPRFLAKEVDLLRNKVDIIESKLHVINYIFPKQVEDAFKHTIDLRNKVVHKSPFKMEASDVCFALYGWILLMVCWKLLRYESKIDWSSKIKECIADIVNVSKEINY